MIITIIVTVIAIALLISEKLRPDLVGLLVLVSLGLSGVTSPSETFAGFSSSAVMTIMAISMVSVALQQTGITRWLGQWMSQRGGSSEITMILLITLVSAGVSLFMNNIAAVGVLLPAVMTLSRKARIPPSHLMFSLAFGVTLGGMATLLTTSNIIMSSALRDSGVAPFGLLDFFPIGGPLILIGAIYLITVGRWLMPKESRKSTAQPALADRLLQTYALEDSLFSVRVEPLSHLAYKSLAESGFGQITGLNVLALIRGEATLLVPPADKTIQPGDNLLVEGIADPTRLSALGLQVIPKSTLPPIVTDEAHTLAELVISPHSSLVGHSLSHLNFRERYPLTVLAFWRDGHAMHSNLANLPLRYGDTLLVLGSADLIHSLMAESDFIVMEEDPDAVLRPGKGKLALIITLLTLTIAALGVLPVATTVLAGAVLLILTGCMDLNDAYRSIEWKAIFLIAGMIPLSTALRTTGLADMAVNSLLHLTGDVVPLAGAAIVMAVAFLFTHLMSGQVAALIAAPVALSFASTLGVDPRAIAMAAALGCSLAFPTPFGHPVNIMVMNPGNYKLRDFVRIGLPLTIILFFAILIGLRLFWGL